MNINQFKPGDIVTRVEPRYWVDELGGTGSHVDGSFIGMKLIFRGILNGCIVLEFDDPLFKLFQVSSLLQLPKYMWFEGWEKWVDPKELIPKEKKTRNSPKLTKRDYEEQIKKCVEEEKYEIAEQLRKQMQKKFKE